MHLFSKARSPFTLWSLLIVFCLAIAPAQTQNLFVANQTGNTIREFSPRGGAKLEQQQATESQTEA
jgi:hypothetical protein